MSTIPSNNPPNEEVPSVGPDPGKYLENRDLTVKIYLFEKYSTEYSKIKYPEGYFELKHQILQSYRQTWTFWNFLPQNCERIKLQTRVAAANLLNRQAGENKKPIVVEPEASHITDFQVFARHYASKLPDDPLKPPIEIDSIRAHFWRSLLYHPPVVVTDTIFVEILDSCLDCTKTGWKQPQRIPDRWLPLFPAHEAYWKSQDAFYSSSHGRGEISSVIEPSSENETMDSIDNGFYYLLAENIADEKNGSDSGRGPQAWLRGPGGNSTFNTPHRAFVAINCNQQVSNAQGHADPSNGSSARGNSKGAAQGLKSQTPVVSGMRKRGILRAGPPANSIPPSTDLNRPPAKILKVSRQGFEGTTLHDKPGISNATSTAPSRQLPGALGGSLQPAFPSSNEVEKERQRRFAIPALLNPNIFEQPPPSTGEIRSISEIDVAELVAHAYRPVPLTALSKLQGTSYSSHLSGPASGHLRLGPVGLYRKGGRKTYNTGVNTSTGDITIGQDDEGDMVCHDQDGRSRHPTARKPFVPGSLLTRSLQTSPIAEEEEGQVVRHVLVTQIEDPERSDQTGSVE